MTEIKKATIDDVDVGRFESKIDRPGSGYNFAAIVVRGGAIELHSKDIFFRPVDSTLRMRRYNYGWRTSGPTQSEPEWMRYAFDVADAFESWLVTELARIDREREEAARPKIPTVKAPEGCRWNTEYKFPREFQLIDDTTGETFTAMRMNERAFGCMVTCLKARAEALGKRIVVLEDPTENLETRRVAYSGKEL